MRAWLFQDPRQKQKLGEKKCPWSVGWYDLDGKRKSKRIGSKSMAEKFARKTEGELAAGTYQTHSRKTWKDFRVEYESKIVKQMSDGTRKEALGVIAHFERLVKPARLRAIKTQMIDDYIAKRSQEPSKRRKGLLVSPATVNKELRHLKAILNIAFDYGYLPKMPKVRMVKEPGKLPVFVTADHFTAIYEACDSANMPAGLTYPAADWWRAVLTFCYMTGWRIGEVLALRRDDLDLEASTAITRNDQNKGKRDDIVHLHSVVIDHLRTIAGFEPVVFPWYYNRRTLDIEFHRIQEEAGVHLPCRDDHEHTPSCHLYGFHDLRRAFATMNAEQLSGDALQRLMRHKSYSTTQRYINMAQQMNTAVENLHVPEVLRAASG